MIETENAVVVPAFKIVSGLLHARHQEDWEEISIKVSTSTVRRPLRAANLMGRIARKKPMLTASHRLRRLRFAKMCKRWTKEKVLCTDEAPFRVRNV